MSKFLVGEEELFKRAGKDRFQRGKNAYTPDFVQDYQRDGLAVTAKVEDYTVTLNYAGSIVDGHCTCPDSDGFDFCQHCVSAVLHGNRLEQQVLSLSKGPEKSRIFAYLIGLEKQTLAKHFLELLESDSEQFERYLLKASLAGQEVDFVALKARVTETTRIDDKRNLFSQRQVKAFFARIEQLFGEFEAASFESKPQEGLKLVEYSLARLNKLLLQIDDKWGTYRPSAQALSSLYTRLFALQQGRATTLIKRFEKIYFLDQFNLIAHEPAHILRELEGGLDLFHKRLAQAWVSQQLAEQKIPETEKVRAALSEINEYWQWRKVAEQLIQLPKPRYVQDAYAWQRSLHEFLAQSPMAWLEWAEKAEKFGSQHVATALDKALAQFPNNDLLARRAIQTAVQNEDNSTLSRLAVSQACTFVDMLSEGALEALQMIDATLYLTIYRQIDQINPHDDPEERQYRALSKLSAFMQEHYVKDLVGFLAQDERLLLDQRLRLLKLIDANGDHVEAKKIRENMVPFLLHKQQNRSDDIAAEQLVLLRENYKALNLPQSAFDLFMSSINNLIVVRNNFASLVDKYQVSLAQK